MQVWSRTKSIQDTVTNVGKSSKYSRRASAQFFPVVLSDTIRTLVCPEENFVHDGFDRHNTFKTRVMRTVLILESKKTLLEPSPECKRTGTPLLSRSSHQELTEA